MKSLMFPTPATDQNCPHSRPVGRWSLLMVLAAVTITVSAYVLLADVAQAQSPSQPASARQVAYEYENFNYYNADEGTGVETPTEVLVPEPAPPAITDQPSQSACVRCEHRSGRCASCSASAPWKMPQPCFLQSHGIAIGGWIQQGITFNGNNPANGLNGLVATNDFDGEYQMNQLWLYLHRQADNGGSGWAWGGHVDMMFGTDWRYGINEGLEDRINGFNFQSYGMVLPQFYAEIAFNKLSVKLGHFASILDYEAVPAVANPFYSHSYSYSYTVPQLVTGALADYKLSDQISIQGGFHRGWSQFEDPNEKIDFMGGVKWDSPDKRTSIAYALSSGIQQNPGLGDRQRFVYSLVAKRQFSDRLQYVLVHNLGQQSNSAANGAQAEWYGLNQYFLYTINKRWSANMRFEWMRDDDGARIAGPGNIPGVRAFDGRGYAGDFYEVTLGTSWRPNANLVIRPEARWDWYNGAQGVNVADPFGPSGEQFTFGIDAIVTY